MPGQKESQPKLKGRGRLANINQAMRRGFGGSEARINALKIWITVDNSHNGCYIAGWIGTTSFRTGRIKVAGSFTAVSTFLLFKRSS